MVEQLLEDKLNLLKARKQQNKSEHNETCEVMQWKEFLT